MRVVQSDGAAIRERRQRAGMTLVELGERAIYSAKALSDVERNQKRLGLSALRRVAEALDQALADQPVHERVGIADISRLVDVPARAARPAPPGPRAAPWDARRPVPT